jgi:Cysteine-rich CWC
LNFGEPKEPSAGNGTEQKNCPVCGARFGCMATQETCWCAEVKLGSKATADLRARFSDCLCPRCLALAAAEREVQQLGAKNPTEKPAS